MADIASVGTAVRPAGFTEHPLAARLGHLDGGLKIIKSGRYSIRTTTTDGMIHYAVFEEGSTVAIGHAVTDRSGETKWFWNGPQLISESVFPPDNANKQTQQRCF